jgi:protein MAK11
MTLLHTITHSSRIHDILFCCPPESHKKDNTTGELLLVGAEDHKVSVYRISPDTGSSAAEGPSVIAEMVGHTNRFVLFTFKLSLLMKILYVE